MPRFEPWPNPQTLDEAWTRFVDLYQEVVALRAAQTRWEAEWATLQTENATLRAQVQELTARLGRNSSNSSRPPSSDPPRAPRRPSRPATGRRRGAQPGHVAHQRPFVPPEQVDHVVEHWPDTCTHCRGGLPRDPALVIGEPQRHQVTELPPVRATVTEHRLHRLRCPACGQETRAGWPPDVPTGAFGPRLQATVTTLAGRYRLSRREVADVCTEELGAPLCTGSVDGLCQATSAALAGPIQELRASLPQAAVGYADETGWREAGQRRVLWVVVTGLATVFQLATSRGGAVIKGLLGAAFAVFVVSDRWSAYSWVPVGQRQVCWSHLARDFQGLVDRDRAAATVGTPAVCS